MNAGFNKTLPVLRTNSSLTYAGLECKRKLLGTKGPGNMVPCVLVCNSNNQPFYSMGLLLVVVAVSEELVFL